MINKFVSGDKGFHEALKSKGLGNYCIKDLPFENFLIYAHAWGFGSSGEFTACDMDIRLFESQTAPEVNCPKCIQFMVSQVKLISKFKVSKN